MPTQRKSYVVVTGGGVSAGTTIAYLLDHTQIHISKIFIESGYQPTRKKAVTPKPKSSKLQKLRLHAGLARVMPRHYVFRVLERFGVQQADLIPWAAQRPWRLSLLFGVAIPEDLRDRIRLVDTEEIAAEHGVPIEKTTDLNGEEAIAALEREEPDVLLGLGTRILKPEVLRVPKIGSLNGHSSLLPEYKGGVSEFWQLVQGESETGVTVHWMVPDVDAGEICAQRRWPVPPKADHHKLRLLSLFHRVEPWREVVSRLEAGERPGEPQGESKTPTFRRPTLEMEYDFYCRGIQIAPRTVTPKSP